MSVPAFIDIAEADQTTELRQYLKSFGAEISEENSDGGLLNDLRQIIEACEVCLKEANNEAELESVLNSIMSLILLIPVDKSEGLVLALCEKLVKYPAGDKHAGARIRVLSNLFHGLGERSNYRYHVYTSMIKLATACDLLSAIPTDLDQIKEWVAQWDIPTQKVQNILRLLYEAFVAAKQSEQATKTMIELLGTYTKENASQARDDAQKCIVTCLADPGTYLLDHFLTLKPVKFLEGEPIHNLLTIFVSGKLSHYLDFYQKHKDFVNSLGLSHEENLLKMRILTFMQMAEGKKEIDLDTIQQEMQIGEEEVEPFIIDVVRTKAVRVKIDQIQRKVLISTTTHRTFGKQQWQQLREELEYWQSSISRVRNSLHSLSTLASQQAQQPSQQA
ncbi:eukaryotic translation initiation factor 3 subunit M [Lingula anatina]|uniref:Eukaryotic translation initiation factor 3 subunit M n=1 Tax=Lingula anatina TaxID=7574 RepID=A0A1S3IGS6_LINAN|nr:eukaryotic translation initiation factor 3 subunit M-like [Lingula anatina]XP_013401414.1 eukaryotic translation initiation factor 3 subunit M [Lingula anatina]|eukprot:XP_013397066.1 eukaryotic translation initiation factor 3 subunit M-like [Lingula anatina]